MKTIKPGSQSVGKWGGGGGGVGEGVTADV